MKRSEVGELNLIHQHSYTRGNVILSVGSATSGHGRSNHAEDKMAANIIPFLAWMSTVDHGSSRKILVTLHGIGVWHGVFIPET